ncbi:alcohol dehydrogenase catalytic domain-containing protein [Gordonia soli]|uniref:Putative oxidoreductase n=1 Tax=Gordonia soli NBRC 108243 TaxID=1223545 RepID=M0QHR7_9ACTN|nr:zinc-binding dehydrogenase [Gordonia soli]GAC66952.1 putative oxidoreductase [Gordonia soli NBRC 108243]
MSDEMQRTDPLPTIMTALVQSSTDGPTDMRLAEVPTPRPGVGEVLVRVEAAGVNFADTMQTRGAYGGGPTPPYVAGFEAAGTVVALGTDVTDVHVGDRVMGTGVGAFVQYATLPASQSTRVPSGWSSAQSLGMVLNWGTALAALRIADVSPGDVVLIHAAAGGVGSAAVRLAAHLGARVIASASPDKHDRVPGNVFALIDSRSADLAAEIRRHADSVDVVLESVGRATLSASLSVTTPYRGRIVVFGSASGPASVTVDDLVFTHPISVSGLHIGSFAHHRPTKFATVMSELTTLIGAGVYPPGTPEVHPLTAGPEVLARLEAGATSGKHALDPWYTGK